MFLSYKKMKPQTMTRLPFLVAVLLACLVWQCSAKETPTAQQETPPEDDDGQKWIEEQKKDNIKRTKLPKPRYTVFFASDVPEVLVLVGAAREKLKLAKSAGNLAKSAGNLAKSAGNLATSDADSSSKGTVNGTAEVLNSRKRAEAAVKALTEPKDEDRFAKMAAEVATELYANDTAISLLTEEHLKWFTERHDDATAQEPRMTDAVKEMMSKTRDENAMHPLIAAVLSPARNIFKLAQDAENDAKYVARKRIFTEILVERIESLRGLADAGKAEKAPGITVTCEKSTKQQDAAVIEQHRNAATKAYLAAASAQKIAESCVDRIKGSAVKVGSTYYELKEMLAQIQKADYQEMRVYQSIADGAHANAEECEQIAAGTPGYAKEFMETAKEHMYAITSCDNKEDENEAKWRAKEAQKAYRKALNEMQRALYRLFSVTVSLQQVADAKKAVADSDAFKNAENPKKTENPKETAPTEGTKDKKTEEGDVKKGAESSAAMRDAKKKAVESEKEAEKSFNVVKIQADKAADAVQHVTSIVKQVKELAAQVPQDNKTITDAVQTQLTKAETALQAANQSSNAAQTAAEAVYNDYNKTKSATDSALKEFDETTVENLQKTASETAGAIKALQSTKETEAKKALEEVEKKQKEALDAYKEAKKLVEQFGKEKGFQTLKVKTGKTGDRDGAVPSSVLRVSLAVLCAVVVSMLGAV